MNSAAFDLDGILRDTFVAAVDYHDTISSTNTRGMELAGQDGWQSPLLILARQQLAGRGRGDNRWWSNEGALTFSLLLENISLSIPQQKAPLVSLFAGLAVADALDEFLPSGPLKLKWPNDVYFDSRKLCGILVETTSRRAGAIVIGIGVNVNNSVAESPLPIQKSATSLIDATGRAWDRTDVLVSILNCLAVRLASIDQYENLAETWRPRCYLQGRRVQLNLGSRIISGMCQGIDNQGALLLQTEAGTERCVAGVVVKIE